jgi:two-component system nitrate/nitrite response regulator NarL
MYILLYAVEDPPARRAFDPSAGVCQPANDYSGAASRCLSLYPSVRGMNCASPDWGNCGIRYVTLSGMTGANATEKVRVVVGEDHPLFRDGLVRALTSSGVVDVVAEAGDGVAALALIKTHLPDVALLDYRMPGMDGAKVAAAVRRDDLPTRVLLLSAHDESAIVFHALAEGAAGFLPKESTKTEIVKGVLDCANGQDVVSAALAAGLAGEIRRRGEDQTPVLSPREREVLDFIAQGRSIPAIAAELYLAPSTVKTHVQRLYEKLGVGDRAAAVAAAMRRGLLE